MFLMLVFIAASFLIPVSSVRQRLTERIKSPKNPRDGPGETSPVDTAAEIDLFSTCLAAGLSTAAAVSAVAGAAGSSSRERWTSVASLLALGLPPEKAWEDFRQEPGLSDLANLATMSHHSGAAVAQGCGRISDGLRAEAADYSIARAEKAGVLISLPLAVCFLPAFITLGLIPVVISLGSELLI